MDTKAVIELLCKHLTLSTGISMEPDYFRLAKYNKSSQEAIEAFWSVLHILSNCAILEENKYVSFQEYDKITNTKLNFAFLQYSALEFYFIPETDVYNSRELLLALGWLLATTHVLEKKVKSNIVNSSLGQECSSQISLQVAQKEINSSTLEDEMKTIVHICSKLNHNLKEISELSMEKVRLTTKIHAASINTSGLPHLSVYEMSLIKRLVSKNNKNPQDQEAVETLKNIAKLIDLHSKWSKRENIFYDWMTTVIDESMSAQKSLYTEEFRQELMKFIVCLRCLVKKKIQNFQQNFSTFDVTLNCSSRFLRIQNSTTEAEIWFKQINDDLMITEKEIETNEKDLIKELKLMLKLIQNCVRV
ncbi:tubulin epsilon and delta complex protein 1-like [Leptopilina boulardi]|uniref:tubulin epsilon and delta complex protein 1-like n=1 Tax=Leptopilina boulardi TaxID=63433 RepID=UPI0021F5E211|nr:tubulin epsilon and delta complex protein 1-like [Leptopilina boulardi]